MGDPPAASNPIASPWRAAFGKATQPDALAMLLVCSFARPLTRFLMAPVELRWWPRLEVAVAVGGLGVALVGLLIELLVWMLAIKVAVEGFQAARRLGPADDAGRDAAPVGDRHALSHLLLWLSVALVLYAVALLLGTGWALLLFLAVCLVMPAMVILAALEERLSCVFNPVAWHELVVRIGGGYAPVAMAFAAMALAVLALQVLAEMLLPGPVAAFAARFLLLFALLLGYCRLGGMVGELHVVLGLETSLAIQRPTLASREEDVVMREVDALVTGDRVTEAVEALRALIHRSGASAPVHERYRQLLLQCGEHIALDRHARSYISTLLALGQDRRALALFIESRSRDPGFFLDGPDEAAHLLAAAQTGGHSRAVVDLATVLLDRYPGHDAAMASGLAAARLLAERFGREDEARALLTRLRDRYDGHPLQDEVARALGALAGPD